MKGKFNKRQKMMKNMSALLALAAGTLGLGMSEFGMMSVLSGAAADLNVSIPQAGHFVAAYALGVCAGALLLIFIARGRPLKKTLLVLAALMTAGNLLAALSPDYAAMLAMRFVSGLPHGAFFGVGGIIAEKVAPPGRRTAAVSIMIAGMTVANLFGIPLGTAIAHAFSWRAMFALVAAWDLYTFYMVWRMVPEVPPLPDHGLKSQFAFLGRPAPWFLLGAIMLGNGGVFCWYSYINPLLVHVSGFAPSSMTDLMVVAGAGMVVGNLLAGELADRCGAVPVAAAFIAVMAVSLLLIVFAAAVPAASAVLMFVAAGCLFGVSGPEQVLIIDNAEGGELLGASGAQVAFNLGNAVGAWLGGLPIAAGYSYRYAAAPGVLLATAGLFMILHFRRLTKGKGGN